MQYDLKHKVGNEQRLKWDNEDQIKHANIAGVGDNKIGMYDDNWHWKIKNKS